MTETTAAIQAKLPAPSKDPDWTSLMDIRCRLTVDVPLPSFTIADAVRLKPSSVLDSRWALGTDVPLRINGKLIARGEFEVVGERLAVRLTDLA